MIQISTLAELEPYSGQSLVKKLPLCTSRQQLEQFLSFSGDVNPIHFLDRSSQPVIPANLLISLIPASLQAHIQFGTEIKCFTVGYRSVRFRKQIKLEEDVLLSVKLKAIKILTDRAHIDYAFRFEKKDDGSTAAEGIMSDFCMQNIPSR